MCNLQYQGKDNAHKLSLRKDSGDDDLELYEEAALMREREAEMEREADVGEIDLKEIDNEPGNSIVSPPTYGLRSHKIMTSMINVVHIVVTYTYMHV